MRRHLGWVTAGLLLLTACSTTAADPAGTASRDSAARDPAPPAGSSSVQTTSPTSPGSPGSPTPPSAPPSGGPVGPTGTGAPGRATGPATAPSGTAGRTTRPPDRRPGKRWQPRPGTTWHWQLTGRIDQSVPAQVYNVDLFTTSRAEVAALHAKGRKVICYLSAGSSEDYRPDFAKFPASVMGLGNGWEGERWLDVRRLDVLEPIMAARLDLCRSKGFDGVEADNVDGYASETGFPLTGADQLRYNRRLAKLAHARGLAIGLKNDLDQVPQLVGDFDFAVNEQCFEYSECEALAPFVRAGKAVFHVEYERTPTQFCPTSKKLGMSSLYKRLDLDAWQRTC